MGDVKKALGEGPADARQLPESEGRLVVAQSFELVAMPSQQQVPHLVAMILLD